MRPPVQDKRQDICGLQGDEGGCVRALTKRFLFFVDGVEVGEEQPVSEKGGKFDQSCGSATPTSLAQQPAPSPLLECLLFPPTQDLDGEYPGWGMSRS